MLLRRPWDSSSGTASNNFKSHQENEFPRNCITSPTSKPITLFVAIYVFFFFFKSYSI